MAEEEGLSRWQRLRRHPLLSRLLLLAFVGGGLWLFSRPENPEERTLVLRLEGPGVARLRGLEAQLLSPTREPVQRYERFFTGPPPTEVRLEAPLPEGPAPLQLFLQLEGGTTLPVQRYTLQVGDEDVYPVRVQVPQR